MGTRSITHIIDEKGNGICSIYRQFDGYPSGHGREIFDCMGQRELVNGFDDRKKQVNGMDNAAAMIIAAIASPDVCGGIYIKPFDLELDMGQDVTYTIEPRAGVLHLTVSGFGYDSLMYDGPFSEFDPDMKLNT